MYLFEKPLIRGTLLKRKSQFTALIDIDGEELIAHIPTTNRIGDVENKNLPCLLSWICRDICRQGKLGNSFELTTHYNRIRGGLNEKNLHRSAHAV